MLWQFSGTGTQGAVVVVVLPAEDVVVVEAPVVEVVVGAVVLGEVEGVVVEVVVVVTVVVVGAEVVVVVVIVVVVVVVVVMVVVVVVVVLVVVVVGACHVQVAVPSTLPVCGVPASTMPWSVDDLNSCPTGTVKVTLASMSSIPGVPDGFVYVTVYSPFASVVPENVCAPDTPVTMIVMAMPTTGLLFVSRTVAVTVAMFDGSWVLPAAGVMVTVCGTGGTLAQLLVAAAMIAWVRAWMDAGPSMVKLSVKDQMAAWTAAASSDGVRTAGALG
jgi:hypothetical protein